MVWILFLWCVPKIFHVLQRGLLTRKFTSQHHIREHLSLVYVANRR